MPGTVQAAFQDPASTTIAAGENGLLGAADGVGEAASGPESDSHQESHSPEAATEEQLAKLFADTFEPTENVGYEWVCAYAKECYGAKIHRCVADLARGMAAALGSAMRGVGRATAEVVAPAFRALNEAWPRDADGNLIEFDTAPRRSSRRRGRRPGR